jgi:hypothetical protein
VSTGEVARFCKANGMTFRRDDRFWGWVIAAHDETTQVLFKLTFDVDAPLWPGERNKTQTPYQYVPPPPPPLAPRLPLKPWELHIVAFAVATECLNDPSVEHPALAIAHRLAERAFVNVVSE